MSFPVTNKEADTYYDSFLDEVKAFEEHLPEWLKKYPGGRYIAIYQGKVIGEHMNLDVLVKDVSRRLPKEVVLFQKVVENKHEAEQLDAND